MAATFETQALELIQEATSYLKKAEDLENLNQSSSDVTNEEDRGDMLIERRISDSNMRDLLSDAYSTLSISINQVRKVKMFCAPLYEEKIAQMLLQKTNTNGDA